MEKPGSLVAGVALGCALFLTGCGQETPCHCGPAGYQPQDSPAHVLTNLQVAYRQRDYDEYAKLLADDFHFYFDADTRELKGLPEFWTRLQDSTATGALFTASEVSDIRISLTPQPSSPVTTTGHERWSQVNVLDTFLEVDIAPNPPARPEGLTFRVDGQLQKFYFRTGKTQDDTAAGSPTRNTVYLVEWRDQGFGTGSMKAGGLKPESEPITWGIIKTLYSW